MAQLSYPYMTTGKTIAVTVQTFVGKVMSLLFNMLSRFVIAFLPRSKSLNFVDAVTICSDFGVQENKICHYFHVSPFYLPWSDGTGCQDLWMLSFKSAFSLPSFTLIKKLFSSTSLSDIRVASSAYLRLLMLHSENLFPASDSSSLPFRMMYSVYICIQVK